MKTPLTWVDFEDLARQILVDIGLKEFAQTGAVPALAERLMRMRQEPLEWVFQRACIYKDQAEARQRVLGAFKLNEANDAMRLEYDQAYALVKAHTVLALTAAKARDTLDKLDVNDDVLFTMKLR